MEKPFFWTQEFLDLQDSKFNITQLKLNASSNSVFFPNKVREESLTSPGVGTFGGIYPDQIPVDWSKTWNCLLRKFHGIRKIEIIFPPEFFLPQVFLEQQKHFIDEFQPKNFWDLNHHVPLVGDAVDLLSKGNRKKFRQFIEASGTSRVGTEEDFLRAIIILQKSRERLGVQLSMNRNQLGKAFLNCPDRYTLYVAEVANELVASAVVVKIDSENAYVLYWGDDAEKWRHLSPIVALFVSIFENSQRLGFKVLDLGTSSVSGNTNEGLAKFKENLGALKSRKLNSVYHF